ncbi:M48 family metallopeptidase [Pseudothermotoga sp. U03pept]|uniref:M48 family metallopeptidase n=1 Tax=Pseudothermotoga sp. U03pept TaxID=3447012 RepID=UPI003F03CBE6
MALQITENATLVVKAPIDVDEKVIWNIIQKHRDWIEKRMREIESRDTRALPKEFVDGEGFLYLGRYYKLHIVESQDTPLKFENGFYLLRSALPEAKKLFIEWYKKAAYEKITERVSWWAQKRGFKYNKVNITNAQKRWASCCSKGILNFSWRLIMAPLSVIDYVVVHELVHLEEKRHNEAFWTKVKMLMTDYIKYENWLKKNGHLLNV